MKKLIIGVLMAVMLMISCCGCGIIHKHVTMTVTGADGNEKTVYEYVDGELQSITTVKVLVSSESGAN